MPHIIFASVLIVYNTIGVGRLGVPEDWIIKFIQQKETFCKISPAAILEAIEELVEDSLIYSFTIKSYKSVQ